MQARVLLAIFAATFTLPLFGCHHNAPAANPGGAPGARLCRLGDSNDCRAECDQHGNAGACMELGAMYENGFYVETDLKSALALYSKACDMGNGFACSSAGYLYGTGKGTPINYPISISLYAKACNLGVGQGCYNLGVMYESGYGVDKNFSEAVRNFEYACLIGSAAGCSSAGVAYIMGKGTVQNVELGIKYLKQGCAGGNQWGCDRLQEIANAANGGAAPAPPDKTGGSHGAGSSM